jgi:glycine/D-amino acid oxidase-like deaminating enzyme
MSHQFESVTCDVLVAGSGAAGFAAALTARLAGLDVLMVEKEPLFGGTTSYSAGVIWIPANAHQRAAGIADSREAALAYLTHHVGNRLDRAKAEAFIDNAPAMLDLFEREGFAAYCVAATWADYRPQRPAPCLPDDALGAICAACGAHGGPPRPRPADPQPRHAPRQRQRADRQARR